MSIIESAKKLRQIILQATESLADDIAVEAPELFPSLTNSGNLVKAGTRINWNGKLLRASTDLWDTTANNPDNARIMWEDVTPKGGYRDIPETITAGLAFSVYECGWWKGELYKSLINNNVWNPEQYSSAWEKVGESNG
jgi:hypothetical protein